MSTLRSVARRAPALGLLAVLCLLGAGCNFEPYCLECEGDGGVVDLDMPLSDGSTRPDARRPDSGCRPTGMTEECNGVDDDCDGTIDEEVPTVGTACGTDTGPCARGVYACRDGELACDGEAPPTTETCNAIDDDCDGSTDEGDPGGGTPCGEETGECVRGLTRCMAGMIECSGAVGPAPETCNGADDDCDGEIDDGNPGGGAVCDPGGAGLCNMATQRCVSGALMCIRASGPQPETCNLIDDDCDGTIDEDFDLQNSPIHCGRCGNACMADNARPRCMTGRCGIDRCDPNFHDINNDPMDGCEYACTVFGAEICNGRDDDCDGMTDEGLTPPAICSQAGVCMGTRATCMGAARWRCMYPAAASTGPAGDLIPESDCNGLDDDCDGTVDEAFPMRGAGCTRGEGVCRTTGTLACNTTNDGLSCNAAAPGAPRTETCNGLDDDCDGVLDNGAPDEFATITGAFGSVQIYRYEASHPDATGTDAGGLTHRPCSAAGRVPWTNVTYAEATAACTAVGARLCTEAEWQRACETTAAMSCTWSFSTACRTFAANTCNVNEYDSDTVRPGDQDNLLATGARPQCYSDWGGGAGGQIFDLTGNAREWTATRSAGVNPVRGGSYNTPQGGSTCQARFVVAGDTFLFSNTGFRCCK